MPKSTKKTTQRKAKAAPAQAAPAPVKEEAVSAPAETESTEPSLNDSFNQLMADFTAVRTNLTSLTSRLRVLQKRSDRELRAAQKASQKRRRKTGNRSPSGFVKPTLISSELAAFLKKPKGTEMARTEVTREINSYIREHSLQDPKNGRRILPDAKLRKLLAVKKEEELTYFNLQRYMSPHFAKDGAFASGQSA